MLRALMGASERILGPSLPRVGFYMVNVKARPSSIIYGKVNYHPPCGAL